MEQEKYLCEHYGPMLKMISVKIEQRANNLLKEYDITHRQFRVIVILNNYDQEEATMKDLEKVLNVSQPTVVGYVSRLESKGFVESYYLDDDKRVKHVRLTDKGKDIADISNKQLTDFETRLVSNLTEDEREQLIILLGKIAKNLF